MVFASTCGRWQFHCTKCPYDTFCNSWTWQRQTLLTTSAPKAPLQTCGPAASSQVHQDSIFCRSCLHQALLHRLKASKFCQKVKACKLIQRIEAFQARKPTAWELCQTQSHQHNPIRRLTAWELCRTQSHLNHTILVPDLLEPILITRRFHHSLKA